MCVCVKEEREGERKRLCNNSVREKATHVMRSKPSARPGTARPKFFVGTVTIVDFVVFHTWILHRWDEQNTTYKIKKQSTEFEQNMNENE